MATTEQDRAIKQFLPSVSRSSKLKPFILQSIILAQAATVVIFAVVVTPVLDSIFSQWGAAALHGGSSLAVWLLIGVLSKTVIPLGICGALIWWLAQQRKLLNA